MKFLLDENIRKEIKDFLMVSGYNIASVPKGSSDIRIAKIAKLERRIILTHDSDFSNMLLYPPCEYSCIILIKIHPPIADIIITAMKNLFERLPESRIDKKFIILERDNFR